MKPISPFTQPFNKLPKELPIYPVENALLPGGELPLTISEPGELALFLDALKTGQLIGMIQPKAKGHENEIYGTGCAGRIRQYRERRDGKLNIMLTGICRYRVVKELPSIKGYRRIIPDWSSFHRDYETEAVATEKIDLFKTKLRDYFEIHKMQVDWEALNKLPIENLVNNLVLVLNLTVDNKQSLLESLKVEHRMDLFISLLDQKSAPIWTAEQDRIYVN